MARLQKKAEKTIEKVFLQEILRLLEEMEQQNGEEKKIYHSQKTANHVQIREWRRSSRLYFAR